MIQLKKRKDGIIVYYRCKCCGKEVTIPRQKSRQRGIGHIKDLWCPWCKTKEKFVEIGIW